MNEVSLDESLHGNEFESARWSVGPRLRPPTAATAKTKGAALVDGSATGMGLESDRGRRAKSRGRLRWPLGPALVAAIAYVDPGNVATNLTAGATSGYLLVWVVVTASLVAILVQYQSAKLGVATGRGLPQLCRDWFPRWGNRVLWLQAEMVVLATEVAEFVGAAVGFQLLFGMPAAVSAVPTAAASLLLLQLRRKGRTRAFELACAAAIVLIGAGVGYAVLAVGHQSVAGLAGGLVPRLDGGESLVLAMGIVGATIMPHAIYLHSSLTPKREGLPVGRLDHLGTGVVRALRLDCLVGLGGATLVNVSMIALGAGLRAATRHGWTGDLTAAHSELAQHIGGAGALAFAVVLMCSGVSSSGVGTLGGEVVMSGFLGRRIPMLLRRLITMAPAVVALASGVPLTGLLVLSQVVVSLGVPVALFLLVFFCRSRSVMGNLVNAAVTTRLATCAAILVTAAACGLPLLMF